MSAIGGDDEPGNTAVSADFVISEREIQGGFSGNEGDAFTQFCDDFRSVGA